MGTTLLLRHSDRCHYRGRLTRLGGIPQGACTYLRVEHHGREQLKAKDLKEEVLKLRRNTELSDYVIDKNVRLIKEHYAEKGFLTCEVDVRITNDSIYEQCVNVTFDIDRGPKVRVGVINFEGNDNFEDKRLRRTFKKTHQKSILFFQNRKLIEEDYEADKEYLLDFYNSRGYRNATIVSDSIYYIDDKTLGIDIKVSEGNKYYIRNINWVGNSVYTTSDSRRCLACNLATYTTRSRCTSASV